MFPRLAEIRASPGFLQTAVMAKTMGPNNGTLKDPVN
jgi:hypothetical protein